MELTTTATARRPTPPTRAVKKGKTGDSVRHGLESNSFRSQLQSQCGLPVQPAFERTGDGRTATTGGRSRRPAEPRRLQHKHHPPSQAPGLRRRLRTVRAKTIFLHDRDRAIDPIPRQRVLHGRTAIEEAQVTNITQQVEEEAVVSVVSCTRRPLNAYAFEFAYVHYTEREKEYTPRGTILPEFPHLTPNHTC